MRFVVIFIKLFAGGYEMSDISELKRLREQAEKRNLQQLERSMDNIIRIFKTSMRNAINKNLRSLELKFNLEYQESFDPNYFKRYESTKAMQDFTKECNRNNVKLNIKLKGMEALIIKASW